MCAMTPSFVRHSSSVCVVIWRPHEWDMPHTRIYPSKRKTHIKTENSDFSTSLATHSEGKYGPILKLYRVCCFGHIFLGGLFTEKSHQRELWIDIYIIWLIHVCDMTPDARHVRNHRDARTHTSTHTHTHTHTRTYTRTHTHTHTHTHSRTHAHRNGIPRIYRSAKWWDTTHSYVWYDSFISVTWLVHI